MIVDTLTHVWESPEQLGRTARRADTSRRGEGGRRDPHLDRLAHADPVEHFESLGPVDVSLVFAFASRLLESTIPNRLVSDYVRSHPDRLIGVAGIDPIAPGALADLDRAIDKLGLRAVAISPSAQGFHPVDSRVTPFYRRVAERNLALFVHAGPAPAPAARLEYASPVLLDEVLRAHDGLKVVLNLAGPWLEQKLALMAKHPQVLATVGGLLRTPWQAYNVLVLAQEAGLIDRLLFASDFPFALPVACIETLYSINRIVHGTNLPAIPRELLRGIVERDAMGLLGLEPPRPPQQNPVAPQKAAAPAPTPIATGPEESPQPAAVATSEAPAPADEPSPTPQEPAPAPQEQSPAKPQTPA